MIKSVKIRNFKSIGAGPKKIEEIELAPLTIFVGPNGSGKSSILQAVAVMAQCVRKKEYIMRALRGELVDFEEKKSIFWKEIETQLLSLGFGAEADLEDIYKAVARERKGFARVLGDLAKGSPPRNYVIFLSRLLGKLRREMRSKMKTIGIEYLSTVTGDMRSYEHSYSLEDTRATFEVEKGRFKHAPEKLRFTTKQGPVFLPYFDIYDYESEFFRMLSDYLKSKISSVYYLSAERGSIPWTYEPIPTPATWVGKNGEYTLEILTELMKPEFDVKRLPYELFCEKFGIGRAWAGYDKLNALTSNYEDPFLKSSHKFPSLGQGSKQLLPVITQLAYSGSGSIILVEEPEMSLHPAYQRILPALFGKAVKEGKQILLTTHSSYFPLSLNLVLKSYNLSGQTTRGRKRYRIQLSTDDILVYHVERDRRGHTNLEKLDVDENGLKEGIPSFIDVEREILGRFMSKE